METQRTTGTEQMRGTIQHAIFVERSTNPDCPVADLINEALSMGDIEMAYQIALDSLKPRKSFKQAVYETFRNLIKSNSEQI